MLHVVPVVAEECRKNSLDLLLLVGQCPVSVGIRIQLGLIVHIYVPQPVSQSQCALCCKLSELPVAVKLLWFVG